MACTITYKGKDYSHGEFQQMLHDGLLDELKASGDVTVGKPKALLNRAYSGATEEQIKSAIEKHGLTYAPESHEEASRKADSFINEVGLDYALAAVQNNEVNDASSAYIYSKAIDSMDGNPQRQAELISEFDKKARTSGQFISALADVYKASDFNYNLQRQLSEYEKAGGKITAELKARFEQLDKQLKEANEKIKELENKKNRFGNIQEEARRDRLKKLTEDRRKKISSFFNSLKGDVPKGMMMASPAPIAIALWNGSIDVIKTTVLAGYDVATAIQAGIDYIKKHSKEPFDEAVYREHMTPLVQKAMPQEEKIPMPYMDNGKLKISPILLKELVSNGASTIEELTDQVMALAKESNPNITEREVRDAITQYGKTQTLSKDEIDTELRKMKRIGRMISALEDVRKKQRPLRSGLQRDKLSDEERKMQREIKEEMKNLPMDEEEEARTWKTALDQVKSRLMNQIADLEKQIETGEKTPKKKGIEYDAEANALKKQRDELREIIQQMEGRPEISEEQRIKAAVSAAEKSLNEYERRIKEKDFSKKQLKPIQATEELKALRERRDNAKKIYQQLKETEGVADKERLEASRKAVRKQITEYQRRLNEKDFSKKPTKEIVEDQELKDLKLKKNQIKEQFDLEQEKNRLKNRSFREKAKDVALDVWNLPKSLEASVDMSAPFRQGFVLSAGNPKAATRAFKEMFVQAFSSEKYSNWLHNLRMMPEYQDMKASGLYIAEPNVKLTAREESFLSNFAEKIPIIGETLNLGKFKIPGLGLISKSNRAYTAYLNKLRSDVFIYEINNLKDQGIEFRDAPQEYKAIANFINNATGRGNLGPLEMTAPILNGFFFSPRFVASRINLLNPTTYITMPPKARKVAMRNMLAYIGFYVLIASMAKAAWPDDVEIEMDPRSTDFGKLKIKGKTRFDLGAGFQQVVRFISQFISGESKRGLRINEESRKDILERFVRSKFAPMAGVSYDFITGKDFVGYPIKFDSLDSYQHELSKVAVPLYIQDMQTIYKQDGPTGILTSGLPAFFGVGVQNYPEKHEIDTNSYKTIMGTKFNEDLLPSKPQKKITVNKKPLALSDEEYDKFSSYVDEERKDLLQKHKDILDNENAEEIKDDLKIIYEEGYELGKEKFMKEKGMKVKFQFRSPLQLKFINRKMNKIKPIF